MFRVGAIEVYLIQDGIVQVDAGGPFGLVPRKLYSRYIMPDAENLVPMNLHCLLIKVDDKLILADTGMGIDKLDEKQARHWGLSRPNGSLFDALGRLGLSAGDIDIVVNTHLHADHCTGNTRFDPEAGALLPSFPNARHIVQRREYADASQPNERTRATYFAENFQPLYETGQLDLLEAEEEEITSGVRVVRTPGHTAGHMSVIIQDGGESAMFLCDLASYAIHFERLGWMTAYDVEPLITLESKRRWQRWALEHSALLITPHDTLKPVSRLRQDANGHLSMEAVDVTFA